MMQFIIPLPPITKKNSQRIRYKGARCNLCGKGAHPFPAPSAAYEAYQEAAGAYMPKLPKAIDYPVSVRCLFYMPTRQMPDLTNALEAIDDILVHYGVLADDNPGILVHHDGSRVLYDKDNPRTEVTIERLEDTMKKPEINSDAYIVRTYTGVKHIKRGRISEIRTTPDGSLSVTVFGIGRGIWGDRVFDTFDGAAARLED